MDPCGSGTALANDDWRIETGERLKLIRAKRNLLRLEHPMPTQKIRIEIARYDVEEAELEPQLRRLNESAHVGVSTLQGTTSSDQYEAEAQDNLNFSMALNDLGDLSVSDYPGHDAIARIIDPQFNGVGTKFGQGTPSLHENDFNDIIDWNSGYDLGNNNHSADEPPKWIENQHTSGINGPESIATEWHFEELSLIPTCGVPRGDDRPAYDSALGQWGLQANNIAFSGDELDAMGLTDALDSSKHCTDSSSWTIRKSDMGNFDDSPASQPCSTPPYAGKR